MDKGYISLWRSIQDNEIWFEEPFTRAQAWIDLLLLANHKKTFMRVRGIRLEVGRGQIGRAKETLADRWQWSRSKVMRFLNELEEYGMIEQQTSNKNSRLPRIISIVNYEKYQENEQQKNNKRTINEQQKDTNNNDNKLNNDNKSANARKTIQNLDQVNSWEELEEIPSSDPFIHHRKMEGKQVFKWIWDGWEPTRRGDMWEARETFFKCINWEKDGELKEFKQATGKYAGSEDIQDKKIMNLPKFLKQWRNWNEDTDTGTSSDGSYAGQSVEPNQCTGTGY